MLQSHWFSINFRHRKWRISRWVLLLLPLSGCCWIVGIFGVSVDITRYIFRRRWASCVFRNVALLFVLFVCTLCICTNGNRRFFVNMFAIDSSNVSFCGGILRSHAILVVELQIQNSESTVHGYAPWTISKISIIRCRLINVSEWLARPASVFREPCVTIWISAKSFYRNRSMSHKTLRPYV